MTTLNDEFSIRPHTLRLTVTTASQSVAGNYSDLSCKLEIIKDPAWDSYSLTASANEYSATIDGSTVSGTFTFDFRSSSSKTLRTWTKRVYHDSHGEKTASISASVDAEVIGVASVSGSHTPPDITQDPPAPSGVTASRESDTQITVSWTRNTTPYAPYASQTVKVSVDGGAYTTVANVSGSATSYSFTAAPNHKYEFKIVASNAAGSATSSASSAIYTTPAALASLSAAVVSPGTVRITLPVRSTPYTEAQVVITESHDGGSTWNAKTTLAMSALSASTATTWDDTSAETSGSTQYRAVVQTTAGAQGTLSSTARLSNTLTLNTPPNAPTGLTPSGAVDASNAIRLAWTHSPSADGASQSSRKIEYSTDGGSTQTPIVTGDDTTAYYDWVPDTGDFTAGQTIFYRVATAGSQPGTYGDWSEWQTLTLYGSLAIAFETDMPPAVHGGGPLEVAWTSSPTWGTATQTRHRVTMADDASGQIVYDTGMVAGTTEAVTIPANVQQDGHTYTVTVTLLDNHQVTSQPTEATVMMDYLEPGAVTFTWSYDDETGTLVVYPEFSEETSSALDDTVQWTLERSLDGVNWTEVATVEGATPIGDVLVRVSAASWYRSTGYTSLGVAGVATVAEVPASDVTSRWGWLNYGSDYGMRVRFGWSQTVDITAGRASESYEIEGGDYPAAVFGSPLSERYAIAGKLLSGSGIAAALASSTGAEMLALSKLAKVCVFRDGVGRWCTARVTDMKVSPARKRADGVAEDAVSFTVERVTA